MSDQFPPIVILAAGSSSRTSPLTDDLHKSEIGLHGKMLIEYTLISIASLHPSSVIIVVGNEQQAERFEKLQSLVPSSKLTITVQHEPSGMGDAVLRADDAVGGLPDEFYVIAPYHFSGTELLQEMHHHQNDCVVVTTLTDSPWNYGIVTIENDTVSAITEKPTQGEEPSNQKIQALYKLNPQFLDQLRATGTSHYSFETALNSYIHQQPAGYVAVEQGLPSFKFAWDLFTFQAKLFAEMETSQAESATIADTAIIDTSQGSVVIQEGATLGDFVKIIGPCYIGNDARIGDYSFIRGSSIEAGAVIGARTEVVRSIIMETATMHHGYIADSIVGKHTKIGAGLTVANKRLDRAEITTLVKGDKTSTGRTALGVIIGNNASLGISVSTMPGVQVSSDSVVMPGELLSKNTSK